LYSILSLLFGLFFFLVFYSFLDLFFFSISS
jgi:hypothetical protein